MKTKYTAKNPKERWAERWEIFITSCISTYKDQQQYSTIDNNRNQEVFMPPTRKTPRTHIPLHSLHDELLDH